MAIFLYSAAGVLLLLSAIKSREKTKKALKAAWNMFFKTLPVLLVTLTLVSVVLYFLPDTVIAKYLGTDNLLLGAVVAAVIGSVSLIPGFITFPLCGLLLKQGVSYTVIASFSTTLMMVGIATFPIEKEFFGTRLSVIRNIAAFFTAIIVSVLIGLIYGEIV
jgi:uncharacterized membrane protein YraQ (UPF0718 family)